VYLEENSHLLFNISTGWNVTCDDAMLQNQCVQMCHDNGKISL